MKYKLYTLYTLIIALVFLVGCEKEYESIEVLDEAQIQTYIKQNGLTLSKSANGVYTSVIKPGTGAELQYSDKVPLLFTLRTLDGSYIDTDTIANHYGGTGQFLGYLSPEGLRTAVKEVLQKVGGEIRVIIPSNLAYGRNGSGPIPGNSSLDYSVKVLNKDDMPAYDELSIQKYMQANGLTGFTKTADNLHYKIITMGTGSPITADSTVTTKYTGKLLNGKIFQTTGENTANFTVSGTIEGFAKTIPLIKGGGTIRFLIPSALGYGMDGSQNERGQFTIPPFSCLDFEVTVTDVSQ